MSRRDFFLPLCGGFAMIFLFFERMAAWGETDMTRLRLSMILVALSLTGWGGVFFQGKQVITPNWQVDIAKLCFAASPAMPDQDRIQGQLAIRVPRGGALPITLELSMLDANGTAVETVTITPETCTLHGKTNAKFPFCGVENENVSGTKGKQTNLTATQMRKSAHAWFYADFPQRKEVKSLLVVDVRIGSKSVNYTSRLVGNKVPRSYTGLPKIQHGTRATFKIAGPVAAEEKKDETPGGTPPPVTPEAGSPVKTPAAPAEAVPVKPDPALKPEPAPDKPQEQPVKPQDPPPVKPQAQPVKPQEQPVKPLEKEPEKPLEKPAKEPEKPIRLENEDDLMKMLFKQ